MDLQHAESDFRCGWRPQARVPVKVPSRPALLLHVVSCVAPEIFQFRIHTRSLELPSPHLPNSFFFQRWLLELCLLRNGERRMGYYTCTHAAPLRQYPHTLTVIPGAFSPHMQQFIETPFFMFNSKVYILFNGNLATLFSWFLMCAMALNRSTLNCGIPDSAVRRVAARKRAAVALDDPA